MTADGASCLARRERGDGLGALGDGVLGELARDIFALKVGDLSTFEATSMKALIPVTIVIAIVGVVATVMDMVNKIGDQKGAPFGCSTG